MTRGCFGGLRWPEFLQTPAPVLAKFSGRMDARFLSSVGQGFGTLIGRAQIFPAPALDKNQSPRHSPELPSHSPERQRWSSSEVAFGTSVVSKPWLEISNEQKLRLRLKRGRKEVNMRYN